MRALLVVLTVLVAPAARAGADADARRLMSEGEELGRAGRFEPALERFKRARAIKPTARQTCFIALAYARLRQWSRAQFFIESCRADASPPRWVPSVRKEIVAAVKAGSFAMVDVGSEPPGATVRVSVFDEDETFVAPRLLWLPLGVHTLELSLAGHEDKLLELEVATNAQQQVRGVLEPVRVAAVEPEPGPAPQPEPESVTQTDEPAAIDAAVAGDTDTTSTVSAGVTEPDNYDTIGWTLVGVGAAGVVAAVLFHVFSADTRSTIQQLEPPEEGNDASIANYNLRYDDRVATLESFRTATIIAYGAGGAAAVAGVVLLLMGEEPPVSVAVGEGGAALMWRGAF